MTTRARQRAGLLALVAVSVLVVTTPTRAYNDTGHYYTVAAVTHSLLPKLSPERASLVAFCAQLPDIAEELDATKVYRGIAPWRHPIAFAAWVTAGKSWDESVGRMAAVQQLLHGLTGGQAQAMRDVAERAVRDLAQAVPPSPDARDAAVSAALCALGFGLHLDGDAFAHRRLDEPRMMYPSGQGHAADIHRPDYVLYEPTAGAQERAGNWKSYALAMANLLGGFTFGQPGKRMVDRVMDLPRSTTQPRPTFWNTYDEGTIREFLADTLPLPKFKVPPEDNPSGPCQAYVNERFKEGLFGTLAAPQCQEVWRRFRTTVEPVLTGTPGARGDGFVLGFADPVFAP